MRKRWQFLLLCGFAGAVCGWLLCGWKYRSVEKLYQAVEVLDRGCIYAGENWRPTESMMTGLMDSLDDRYSYYMDPGESAVFYGQYREDAEYLGFGMEVIATKDGLRVGEVESASPAMMAGMARGDVITAIDGRRIQTPEDIAVAANGDFAVFTVNRKGKAETLYLAAAEIAPPKDYVFYALSDGIWYLRIRRFMEEEMEQEIASLFDENRDEIKGLLIDLRANPGGRLDAAVDLASLFLEKGTVIVSCEEKGKERETLCGGSENPLTMPLIVLQDKESASAAEVLAGALKCHHRGVIVGETSVGKGTMQRVYGFPDGSSVRYTCGRYDLPDGSSIDGTGITPDVPVPRDEESAPGWALCEEWDTQQKTALEVLMPLCRSGGSV